MIDLKQIDCFKVNIKFWRITGIWPLKNFSRFDKYYSKLVVTLFIIIYNTLFSINFYFVEKNLDSVIEEMIFYFTEVACTSKVFTYLLMREQIENLLTSLESDMFQPKTFTGLNIVEKAKKLTVRFWRIIAGVSVTCNIAHVFIPVFAHIILSTDLKLPVCSYSFLSPEIKHKFIYPLYFYQSVGIHLTMWYNVNIDTFILGILILAIAQLDILDEKLRVVADDDLDLEDTEDVKETKLLVKLNKCIIHYGEVNKFCLLIEQIFSVTLFVQFSMASYIICVCLFRFTMPAPMQYYVFLATYMFVMILQVLIPCWYGTRIIVKSSQLSQAVYDCDWTGRFSPFKTNLRLFVERTLRPLSVTGWKMFPLSLNTFTSIINSAYSFFTLLRHMQSRQ